MAIVKKPETTQQPSVNHQQKDHHCLILGVSPQTPGVYRIMDQSMKSIKSKGPHFKCDPYTSATLPVLGSLPSVALSPGRIILKYTIKLFMQHLFNYIRLLNEYWIGNFNCR